MVRMEALICGEAFSRLEPSSEIAVVVEGMSLISFLPEFLRLGVCFPSNVGWGDSSSAVEQW